VVKTVEKMGRRKLAYTVRKFNDGNYVLLTIEANGPVVPSSSAVCASPSR
jgi:small subunit ribosomal protein S6